MNRTKDAHRATAESYMNVAHRLFDQAEERGDEPDWREVNFYVASAQVEALMALSADVA